MGWNMKKAYRRTNQAIREICRDIGRRANDRTQLQSLILRLEALLRENRDDSITVKITAQQDDPFDKIMVV
jgi:hypothetical protein